MEEKRLPAERTSSSSAWKQLIIARKDLNMSPGKLAAQVSHGSMAWLTTAIKQAVRKFDDTERPVHGCPGNKDGVLLYRRNDLYQWAKEAHERGEDYFYCKRMTDDPNDYRLVLCDPEPYYECNLTLDSGIYEGWIEGSFTKIVCEARNRNHLMKATTIAQELGLEEGKDYFLIKDNCLTELEPEEVDENGVGRTLTVVGFRPLSADVCAKISRKFQLYGATAPRPGNSEFCDWCQGSASDLVYNLDDMEWGGEIDGETGWMTTFHNKIGTIGSRQVRFCPMCGRAVGRASKHD